MSEAKTYFTETPPKGEFVICLEPTSETDTCETQDIDIEAMARKFLDEGCSTKETAAKLAKLTGKSKKELYSYTLNLIK